MTRILSGVGLVALLVVGSAAVEAQRPPAAPLTIDSLTGRDTFEFYCAACHGRGGRGDGPLASSLKTAPSDLTVLSAKSGGTFPRERVAGTVRRTERSITAHSTGEMPVWGTIFEVLDQSAERSRVRIDNVVAYVETLQVQSRPTAETGRILFQSYCASCHGPQARGNGALAQQLRKPVPDLTQYTMRNGGMFPSERVTQIIEGRGVAAHGPREMPVWGDAFRASKGGYSADTARGRIDAIVRYLEGIQDRPAE